MATRRVAISRTLVVAGALIVASCTGGLESPLDSSSDDSAATAGSIGDGVTAGAAPDGDEAAGSSVLGGTVLGGTVLPPLEVPNNTLVWVHDQEPTSMHFDDPQHRLPVASWIRRSLLEGLYGVSGANDYYPELLADEGSVVEAEDGSVTIELSLRSDLMWSNGDRLTADHVGYTWEIWSEGCQLEDDGTIADGSGCRYAGGDRAGLDLISDVEVLNDTDLAITFVSFHAGWKGLFDEIFHPSFGDDAAEVNQSLTEWTTEDGEPLVAAGPMVFSSWERGLHIGLIRNDRYHGSMSPDARNRGAASVDGVLVRFVADTETLIAAIEAGEAHVLMTDAQVEFGPRLTSSETFTAASAAGPVFEHWSFNLLNRHLADPAVREAIAFAIDKSAVVDELYRPLFGAVLPSEGLGNAYWMTNQRAYEDHQAGYARAQKREATERLVEAGYALAEDDMFVHADRGPLSLRVGTTGGDAMRERQQELLAEQLRAIGIEVTIDNVEGSDYFTERPFSGAALLASVTAGDEGDAGVWDIAQFAWAGSPWPGANSKNYLAGQNTNPYGFANEDFVVQAAECDATVDASDRAGCYNDLDLFLTTLEKGDDGLVLIPITQRPAYYGYLSSVLSGAGIASDADDAGPLANVVDFSFK